MHVLQALLHFTFDILHFKKVSTTFTANLNMPINGHKNEMGC